MVGGRCDGLESFEEFAAAAMPWLLGVAHALTRNEHDAWDLTQDTLVRLCSRWSVVEVSNPRGYARTTMVRLNIDRVRRLRVSRRAAAAYEERVVAEPMPEDLDAWLVEGMAQLSARQRTAVVLRYAEDLEIGRIASEMGCSVGTVRGHLSRGVARLRRHAASVEQEEGSRHGLR